MSFHTFCKAEPTFPKSQTNWEEEGDLNEDGNRNLKDINKTLTDIGGYFEEHDSPMDGNCFYHSIVDYIEGNDNELTTTIFETKEYFKAYDTNSVNFNKVSMFNMHWLRYLVWKESLKLTTNELNGDAASESTRKFREKLENGVEQTISDKNEYTDENENIVQTKSHGHVGIDLWTEDREIDVTARLLGIDICTLQTIGDELKWVVSLHDPNNAKLDGLVCFLKNNGVHFTNLTYKGNTARMNQLRQQLRAERIGRNAAKMETPYLSEDLTNMSIKELKKIIANYNKNKSNGKKISGHSKLDQSGLVQKIVESGLMKKSPPPLADKKQNSSNEQKESSNEQKNGEEAWSDFSDDFESMTKGELKSWIKKYNSDKHVWQKITRFLSMDKQGLKDRIRKQILLDKDETVFDMGRLDTMSKSELESWAEHNIYGKKVSILWQMEKLFRLTKEKIIKFLKEITPLDSKQELYIACFRGQAEVVQLLLSDPNIQINEILINRVGPTRPKSVIKVVTNRQNKFISREETTTTVSSDICGTPLYIACKKGHTNIVQLLLTRKDILINKTDPHNILRPPLYIACEEGHTDIVQLLLTRKDINVNLHDHFSHGPLYIACEKGRIDVVRLLLTRKDINVNMQDTFSHGPLYIACEKGHTDIVRLLLDQPEIKINIKQRSHFLHGEPYIADELYIAREKGYTDIVRLLLDRPEIKIEMAEIKIEMAKIRREEMAQIRRNLVKDFFDACNRGRVDDVRLLLAQPGIQINQAEPREGWTPLYIACFHGRVEIVRLLLAREEIKINQGNRNGSTPLSAACEIGYVDVVRLLLARKEIQINQAANDGRTPLWTACGCINPKPEIVRLLLARKEIQINQAATNGATPLLTACQQGHVKVVKLLLARPEILINKAKNNGSTPLYGACYWGKVEVVRLLLTNKDIDINQAGPYQFSYNNREMHGTPLKIAQLHLRNQLGSRAKLDNFRKIIALFKNK